MLIKNLTAKILHKYEKQVFQKKRFLVKGRTFVFCNVKVLGRIMRPGEEKGM
jgi:hypothetical protein